MTESHASRQPLPRLSQEVADQLVDLAQNRGEGMTPRLRAAILGGHFEIIPTPDAEPDQDTPPQA